jgi:hypothetical protein
MCNMKRKADINTVQTLWGRMVQIYLGARSPALPRVPIFSERTRDSKSSVHKAREGGGPAHTGGGVLATPQQLFKIYCISGFSRGPYEHYDFWVATPCSLTFRGNLSPPSSGSKNKPINKVTEASCLILLVYCLVYSSILKIVAMCSSETSGTEE